MTDPASRLPKVTPEQWTDEIREVFEVLTGPGFHADQSRHHVISTFALHPRLATPFLRFNKHLLAATTLPIRLRQIAILRVAWKRRAVYMWSSHVRLSLTLDLGREEFEAVKAGAASGYWSDFERTLVRAVDQLCDETDLDEATWAALAAEFDHQQILDLIFTVGCYAMLAMVFNAARIDREADLVALGAEYGTP
jgi:alkylhydroperoxidase family enzyme